MWLWFLLSCSAHAQVDPHQHHHPEQAIDHSAHGHDIAPAGKTCDLRWLDAMVQHHTGALRMSDYVFDIGEPWYPEAPMLPLAYRPGADPNGPDGFERMSAAQIDAMRMISSAPTRKTPVRIMAQGREILALRRMLLRPGLNKRDYYKYDRLFTF